jgi:hypothetical protein
MSAFATHSRLVLGQEAVDERSNEIIAIPALLERWDLKGALVCIDAISCNPTIAEAEDDYLLAVKDSQPTLHARSRVTSPPPPPRRAQALRPSTNAMDGWRSGTKKSPGPWIG